jgi:hypothetical protein
LVYRLYITYTLMEFLFGLDQSDVCRDIRKIERLIRRCLPIPQRLYNVTKRLKTKEEIEQYFPGFMAFTDCTEQPIPRPNNRKKRKLYYSGKKKTQKVIRLGLQITITTIKIKIKIKIRFIPLISLSLNLILLPYHLHLSQLQ